MLKDTTREVEIDAVETPKLLQLLPGLPPKKPAFARIRTLHGLLKVASDDFEAVLAQPGVVINMDDWVRPTSRKRCAVCLAGSVMYQQYGIRSHTSEEDMGLVFGHAVARRLDALNALRVGHVASAWLSSRGVMEWELPRAPKRAISLHARWSARLREFTYNDGLMSPMVARLFLGEMRALQKDLKTAGL